MRKTNTMVEENDSYAETAVYQHVDKGQTRTKMYNSVNSPVKIDASEQGYLVTKVRTLVHVTEDRGVQSDTSNYEKVISTEQVRDGATGNGNSTSYKPTRTYDEEPKEPTYSDGLSPLKVLKNFVDNIAADNRLQWICIVALGVIAASALALALI